MRIELTIEVLQTSALPLGYRALIETFHDPSLELGISPAGSRFAHARNTAQLGYRALGTKAKSPRLARGF